MAPIALDFYTEDEADPEKKKEFAEKELNFDEGLFSIAYTSQTSDRIFGCPFYAVPTSSIENLTQNTALPGFDDINPRIEFMAYIANIDNYLDVRANRNSEIFTDVWQKLYNTLYESLFAQEETMSEEEKAQTELILTIELLYQVFGAMFLGTAEMVGEAHAQETANEKLGIISTESSVLSYLMIFMKLFTFLFSSGNTEESIPDFTSRFNTKNPYINFFDVMPYLLKYIPYQIKDTTVQVQRSEEEAEVVEAKHFVLNVEALEFPGGDWQKERLLITKPRGFVSVLLPTQKPFRYPVIEIANPYFIKHETLEKIFGFNSEDLSGLISLLMDWESFMDFTHKLKTQTGLRTVIYIPTPIYEQEIENEEQTEIVWNVDPFEYSGYNTIEGWNLLWLPISVRAIIKGYTEEKEENGKIPTITPTVHAHFWDFVLATNDGSFATNLTWITDENAPESAWFEGRPRPSYRIIAGW